MDISSFPVHFILTESSHTGGSLPVQYGDEALDALFGSGGEEEEEEKEVASPSRSLLSSQELALFDPFSKEGTWLGWCWGEQLWGGGREIEGQSCLQSAFHFIICFFADQYSNNNNNNNIITQPLMQPAFPMGVI